MGKTGDLRAIGALLVAGALAAIFVACVGDDPEGSEATPGSPDAAPVDGSSAGDDAANDAGVDSGNVDSGSADGGIDASSAYANAVLADAPLAYLRLGESTGLEAKDERGLYNGTLSPTGVTLGAPGATSASTAVTIAGTGCIDMQDVLDFTNHSFTLEAWVKPSDFTTRRGIVTKVASPAGYALFITTDGKVQVGTSVDGVVSTAVLSKTAFTHVVAVWGSPNAQIYFNAQLVADAPVTSKPPDTSAHVGLGCFLADSNPYDNFVGVLDEVAFYDKPLSAARVTAHYDAASR